MLYPGDRSHFSSRLVLIVSLSVAGLTILSQAYDMVREDTLLLSEILRALQRYESCTGFTSVLSTLTFQALICAEVIWCFAITTVKGSILYLYHRIFSFNNRSFSITLWIVGIFIIGYCLTQTFAATFQCVPIDSQWHPEKPRTCVPNIDLGATIIASFNVLTDFVILILPMPLLYKLQRPLREKLSIMGIFLLGGL